MTIVLEMSDGAATGAPPALLGRYQAPDVSRGDRVYCRYRKGWCRVTGWSAAPIPWPRVQQIAVRGRPGLLANATLERAIRTESAAALMHWFGVSSKPVVLWRRAFGADGRLGTPGSRTLIRRGRPNRVMPGADRVAGAAARRWSAAEIERLGTDRDEVVAAVLGRPVSAVTRQRSRCGVRAFDARAWTAAEIAQLGTNTDEVIAARIGRTVVAVTSKRLALRVPPANDAMRTRGAGCRPEVPVPIPHTDPGDQP